jgi:membrane protease YdiL (CAAX protease family)
MSWRLLNRQWPLWRLIVSFWLYLVLGALGLMLVLLAIAGLPLSSLAEAAAIPQAWQAAYFAGLYALLWGLYRYFQLALGLAKVRIWPLDGILGLLAGLLSALLLLGLQLWLGWGRLQTPSLSWELLLEVLGMAFAVAWIEEHIFRVLQLDLFKRELSVAGALHAQAVLYALVHLMRTDLGWLSWFNALAALYLVGLLLGRARLRSGSLGWSIGLHAGWILATNLVARSQLLSWDPAWGGWSGSGNPVYGLSGLIFLLAVNLLMQSASSDAHPEVV